ncbi:PREDICTED: E3 ubiquitin-protein ligase UPL1-like isoform X2 [Populus euphratica]|uniref:HECT-type E3 ubiquitin transferase n=1 Tax=Populus euphratica TaxID=75702 RepID=A0AAJ6Y731_POPEU|nr:PREDICTED: E3 ubiquitin-protein ligase UPL1-like isoform X2 [Populus euphratica]
MTKLKKRRSAEVPPKIKSFINGVITSPLENIEEPLKGFVWEFDKGDFHHWVDLFNHFDSYFEKRIKPRKDLQVEDNFLESDPPFPREALLQILRVIRIILENCTNKHFYSSYEHLSNLLASTDADIVEASLQTLAAFLNKTLGRYSIKDLSLNTKLFSLAQGWGGKDEGLGLVASTTQNGCDPIAYELGCTLHFEFYALNDLSSQFSAIEQPSQGLQIIHLPNVDTCSETDCELLNKLVVEYKVPPSLRFSLLTRLRFARAFRPLVSCQLYTCIRLYAFIVLVQASSDADDLVSFFNSEPEFVNELVSLLSYEDEVPEKIRILCLLSLVALSQDRSRQSTVLAAVTSGGHRGILSSLMQKAIDSVISDSSKWSVDFAEALLSLVTVLVSSSSGCSAMREAGFIPTLLPLLKDTDPQHLHLVATAVHILEAFMDYSNPAAALFRELGGLDDTISRLKVEVSHVENCSKQQGEDSDSRTRNLQIAASASSELDSMLPLYSEALVAYHRRLLMKALLRVISLGTYAAGNISRIYGSEESLLPQCLCLIFRRAKDFGGGVFSLAATVMSDLIHKDPTCFPILDAAGLPSAFLNAIMDGVLCSSEAIMCIPQCLDALCLNNNGLQAVKDRNALRCFVKIFTSKMYLHALFGEAPGSLSTGLDELMRHASSLRGPGVDMLIEILNVITKIGSGVDGSCPSTDPSCSAPVPMETDAEERSLVLSDDRGSFRMETLEQTTEQSTDTTASNVDSLFPECLSNVAHLLETVLQHSDTCHIFVEKKGIDAVLQLFTLPLMPISTSIGQIISVAFKNFSHQHSASLARAVCAFLREHLKSTNELLVSVAGTHLAVVESAKQAKVLRYLSSLEGILSLLNFLLKGNSTFVSELGTADADVLKDIGMAYREIIWQVSLYNDSKVDERRNAEQGTGLSSSTAVVRESDDAANIPVVRYMNPVSIRNGSQSLWGGEREFLSVIRSGEGLHLRSRHGLAHIRSARTGQHLDALSIDSEIPSDEPETSLPKLKSRTPDEILNKLASVLCSFFSALLKGFTSPNRRRADLELLSAVSKTLGTTLAKIYLEALSFSGYSTAGLDTSLSVKCQYLGKVVDDMATLTFDSKRRTCYASMVNNFYVHGTFKELLTTFEATSQLLWTLPYPFPRPSVDHEKAGEGNNLSHSTWLLYTLHSYCHVLEYFVNSSLLLSSTSGSQVQLLVQPVAAGLSSGLFPVPKDPEVFVRMLQSQVLDVMLSVWNHPMFPSCSTGFISSIVSLVTHIYSGVGDVKRNRSGIAGRTNQRFMLPPPDENTIAMIVEMGFTRARAEEALRRVETNSVEMAMEWLFSHAEDPVQEDDELARALALSLGSSSEGLKIDDEDNSIDAVTEEGQMTVPPVEDILAASVKLFQSSDTMAFSLTDLLVTLCNRNKGADRLKVASYLIEQLKLCPLDFSKDSSALCMISHILALLLFEDGTVRESAAQNGIVAAVTNVLMNFKARNASGSEILIPKCISALLLILDNMLQSRSRISSETTGGAQTVSLPDSSVLASGTEKKVASDFPEKESGTALEKLLGKSTGYLTIEESREALLVACDLMKQHVPAVIMQAILQLCARLTKTHVLALQFLENGGLTALFSIPRSCFFPGYDTVASAIIRHLLEDPHTLQTAMELEIRQTLIRNRHAGRIFPRTFLTSMAPVISRDPVVFMKAAAAACQLESSGGSTFVVLLKEREKERDKSKALGAEESVRISENKMHDGSGKCAKGHKKIPANLTQVMDQLLDIVLKHPLPKSPDGCVGDLNSMNVDEPATKLKGKSKVDDTKKMESESERSAGLAKVTFVLKVLSDVLLMYVHAVGVILRRDLEFCHLRGSNQTDSSGQGGIIHHILHQLILISTDKSAGPDEWRDKLSEKASWFIVVLCGRSGEGRRRVINELVKAMSSFSNLESNSHKNILLPDKKVFAFSDLVYSILSKNASSSHLPGSGCSPDIAKSMIDGGMVQSLTSILQVIDLDHPDAPKIVNLLLKALESLSRAANASEQVLKSEGLNKKKTTVSNGRCDEQTVASTVETTEHNQNSGATQEAPDEEDTDIQQQQGTTHVEGNDCAHQNQPAEQDMRTESEDTVPTNPLVEIGMDFMHEEVEEGGVLHNTDQIEMTFRVENRAGDDMGDEDEDMGDDGDEDEDEDEDEGEDEDEDIAEDGAGMMSLADSDVEDHDDTGLADDYNDDEMIDEEDDFHENRVIEVRWREAVDGLDHLQVLGQPRASSGLIDVAAEPFERVNVNDLFGLRRPLGFDRRRQSPRSSFERFVTEANGFQHPLLLRPSQSEDLVSSGGHSSRGLEALSYGSFDVPHFFMFDAPVLPFEHVPSSIFGDRSGRSASPPLSDSSLGMDLLRTQGRRGPGDGRWTDDGQPQAGARSAAIAQAIEEQFISQLCSVPTTNAPIERQFQNSGVQENQPFHNPPSNDGQVVVYDDNTSSQQNEVQQGNGNEVTHYQPDPTAETIPCNEQVDSRSSFSDSGEDLQVDEPMLAQPISLNSTPNGLDNMEIGDGDGTACDQVETMPEHVNSAEHHASLQCEGVPEAHASLNDVPVQDVRSSTDDQCNNPLLANSVSMMPDVDQMNADVEMTGADAGGNRPGQSMPASEQGADETSSRQETLVAQDATQADQSGIDNETPTTSAIDPTFLEALPEDLRTEVLASQQAQSVQPPTYAPPSVEDIDPEFLAALPPDIQAEVLAQQRAQQIAQQDEGQPVDMDNASTIATFPAGVREEVLLTSSEAVLSALPSPLLAEAQMLRDRAMSHYQAHSLFGSSHRLNSRRNGLGFDRQTVMDRGVGVTIGQRAASAKADGMKMNEIEGERLLDTNALKALIHLLRMAQPLGKGLLQRLLLNLCAHSATRTSLVCLLLNMIKPEAEGSVSGLAAINSQRLYGCQSNVVYGRSQLMDGLPPLVLRRVLEILTYLATNHSSIANMLFYFDPSIVLEPLSPKYLETKIDKGKEKIGDGDNSLEPLGDTDNVPLILFLKLLNRPLFLHSTTHLEQVMGLLQVVVFTAASKLDSHAQSGQARETSQKQTAGEVPGGVQSVPPLVAESSQEDKAASSGSISNGNRSIDACSVFSKLPQPELSNLCSLLGCEGLSDKVYMLAGEVLKKLASIVATHRKFFTSELLELAHGLSNSAVSELVTLRNTHMQCLSAGSMAGAAILRVLQALSSLTSLTIDENMDLESGGEQEEQATMWNLSIALQPLWLELSECISLTETRLVQSTFSPTVSNINVGELVQGGSSSSPLPPGTQRLLPFIEAFFVLCEKLQANQSVMQQDLMTITAREVKESSGSSSSTTACFRDSQRKLDGVVTFSRFAEKHRRLLNTFIRQNPGLLEKSLSMMLKAPRLIDFDNKRAYFRTRIKQQHEQHRSGPLRISIRRTYVLEDSYNQLRMRPYQDLRGRLNVQFQGEEGIDAGGLTREWYQLLSRVVFDKGALLFTTVGNDVTFQPNPNSVYQTEHLSYFKFVGRVVSKALFDGQLLDVYFSRSFYKHILGAKVTYHDIEAVDPDYYKNLKWMLENDVSDIPDLTFSMDADEEKHILYEKTQVTDYELKPGGRNIRVTEETKHEYVDLVADHILTNAIRPQINSFLEGFNELVPRELISIFNDKELELLISGLPEIDLDDLKANTEYTGYTSASVVVQWFWEAVKGFNKEDMARLLQFVTGTSKVPLEGFKALQGISGPQKLQIHKAYGAPERLPSAHTCFNQLDLPEYTSGEQLQERLLLAIHEASEGFGFG